MKTNPIMDKAASKHELLCPQCHHPLQLPKIEGDEVGSAVCPSCGLVAKVKAEQRRVEIFEWCFDNGGHTVFWNVTALRDELTLAVQLGVKLKSYQLPSWLVEHLWNWNPHCPEMDKHRPSVVPDEPILVIPHLSVFAHEFPFPFLPIDGWHRIHSAYKRGLGVAAILIPSQVEQKFRVHDIVHVGWQGNTDGVIYDTARPTVIDAYEQLAEEKTMMDMRRP